MNTKSFILGICTEKFVYEVMRSRAELTAPFAGANPAINCGQVDLAGFGGIITVLGEQPYSITNCTKSNHLFHKGKVVRYLVKVGSKVNIYTVRVGNNKYAWQAYLNQNSLSVALVWEVLIKN